MNLETKSNLDMHDGFLPWTPGTQPPLLHSPYASCEKRAPLKTLITIPQTLSERTGPQFPRSILAPGTCDMSRCGSGEALGQRITVTGCVLDENGRPQPEMLLELWQANTAGRYLHARDQHEVPLDPNFTGVGRAMTDAEGRYHFTTILPGNYPWGNHYNAWRPRHIHFSLFGPAMAARLVTQMYFPGDPLLPLDPIYNCTSDPVAAARLISEFDWETTVPDTSLGFRWDIVLRGRQQTPWEDKLHQH